MPDAERDSEALSERAADVAPARRRGAQEPELLLVPGADPATGDAPVERAEFARALERLGPRPPLAFAVSGGADSMALLTLGAMWARAGGLSPDTITAVTIDHGLRPEAAAEAAQVARWAQAMGHRHVTLRVAADLPRRNIQAHARAERYRLLCAWCAENGISELVLAHQLEDQAETFLQRLGRGSGVDGLSAMAAISERRAGETAGLRLLRPLLDFPKRRLIATLRRHGQAWIEDPSNADPRYSRARLRRLMPELAREGLTPARLAATARRMAKARAALEAQADALLSDGASLHPAGYARLALSSIRAAPEEIGLRALARLLQAAGGSAYPPRLERTERLYAALLEGQLAGGRTLAGCRILPVKGDNVLIVREPSRVAPDLPLRPGGGGLWDGRFLVRLAPDAPAGTVRALGPAGWRQIRSALDQPVTIPAAIRLAVPSLWRGQEVLAVPAFGFARADYPPGRFTAEFLALRSQCGV